MISRVLLVQKSIIAVMMQTIWKDNLNSEVCVCMHAYLESERENLSLGILPDSSQNLSRS